MGSAKLWTWRFEAVVRRQGYLWTKLVWYTPVTQWWRVQDLSHFRKIGKWVTENNQTRPLPDSSHSSGLSNILS
jgi:hypothetical protein